MENKFSLQAAAEHSKEFVRKLRAQSREIFENRKEIETTTMRREHEDCSALLEQLIPADVQQRLWQAADRLDDAEWYECVTIVGSKAQKRNHAHEFVVKKHDGLLELFFVDPEHNIGKSKTSLFPAVANLTVIRLSESAAPELAMLRYKTDTLAAKHDAKFVKLAPQFQDARELIDHEGVPEILQDEEGQTLFRMAVKRQAGDDMSAVVETENIYSSPEQINEFLDGNLSEASQALRDKALAVGLITNRFADYLEHDTFQKTDASTKKRLGL